MLDAGIIDDLTKAANSVKVNSGACPQKGGAGSETGGARGPTRPDLDLSGHNKEEVPDARPLPDSGDNDPSATPLGVESSSEEEVWRRSTNHHLRRYGGVRPLFEPGEAMEEPERPDAAQLLGQKLEAELEARAAQVARPTAGAEKDAAQEGEGGGEEAEAGGEAKGEGGDPKPRAEATKPPAPTCNAESGAEPKAGTPAAKSKALPKPPAPPCNAESGAEPKAGTPAAKSNALPKPPAVQVDPAPPKAGQPAGKTPTLAAYHAHMRRLLSDTTGFHPELPSQKRMKMAAADWQALPWPAGSIIYGCGKCRSAKTGCLKCNPAKMKPELFEALAKKGF